MTPSEALIALNQVRIDLTRLSMFDFHGNDEVRELAERLTAPLTTLMCEHRLPPATRNLVLIRDGGHRLLVQARSFSDTDDHAILDTESLTELLHETTGWTWTAIWEDRSWNQDSTTTTTDQPEAPALMEVIEQRIQQVVADKNWLDAPALHVLIGQIVRSNLRAMSTELMAQRMVAPPDSLLELVSQRAETAALEAVNAATRNWGQVIKERFEDEFSTRLRQSRPLILDLIRGWLPGEIRASLRAWLADSPTHPDDSE